jgi:hypothetical protein
VQSLLAQVDVSTGTVKRRIPKVGDNTHGLVAWRGLFVMLNSKATSLVTLNPKTEELDTIWQARTVLAACMTLFWIA